MTLLVGRIHLRLGGLTHRADIFLDNRALLDAFRRAEKSALAEVYHRYVDVVTTVIRRGAFPV